LSPDQVEYYKKKAEKDMGRYKKEMETFLLKQSNAQKGDGDDDEEEKDTTSNKKLKRIKDEERGGDNDSGKHETGSD
jgi:hypothetical protein